ncbi:MAG TPA: hypothetical protein VGD78_06785 [Chthoniobacterales bacterium]
MRLSLVGQVQSRAGQGFDHREAGILEAALDAAVLAPGHFAGEEFVEELQMALTVTGGLFGGGQGVLEQVGQPKAVQVFLQTGACGEGRELGRGCLGVRGVGFHEAVDALPWVGVSR